MTTIAIIDYGAGNLLSLQRAVEAASGEVVITTDPRIAADAQGIILPGVGAAGTAMAHLHTTGMIDLLSGATGRAGQETGRAFGTSQRRKPLLGICLGMQLFFQHTEEDDVDGLGILPGQVRRLRPSVGVKVPHMGWNRVEWPSLVTDTGIPTDTIGENLAILAGLSPGTYMYFVHAFTCEPQETAATAWTDHGDQICAAIGHDNIWGLQFHPEKSGQDGLQILRNFIYIAGIEAEEGRTR